MTNWILISDIHIDIFEGRLHLYPHLAQDLVQVCKNNNSTELVIAGDIINNSVTPPSVLHTLGTFLKIFKDNEIHVSYLLGQHDYNLKNISDDLNETYLSLFDMEYVGESMKTIEGLKIWFHNYERTNLVKVPDCDILIGHVSLGFQEIDDSNFKLGICGDIHKPIKVGKCISISPPMQIHNGETQQGYYVLLSMDNGKFEYSRGLMPQIFKLDPPQRLKIVNKIKESSIEDFNIPEEIIKDIDLSNLPKPVDLDFKLKKLLIRNFRCWKSYELDFNNQKIFISGRNGSGKSTLLYALYYSFVKSRNEFDELEVEFEYQNHEWRIHRSSESSDNHIYKDNVEILVKGKSEFEDRLIELFPFIPLLDFFFVQTYKHFFDNDRVKLFEEVFNLKSYAYLTSQVKDLIKKYDRNIQNSELGLSNISGQIKSLSDEVIDISINREELSTKLTQLKEWSEKLSILKGMKVTTEHNIESEKSELSVKLENKDELILDQQNQIKFDSLVRSISSIKNKIVICPNCGTRIGAGNVEELEKELESLPEPKFSQSYIRDQLSLIQSREKTIEELTKNQEFLDKVNNRIKELESKVTQSEIDDLSSKLSLYDKNESIKNKISELQIQYDSMKEEESKYSKLVEISTEFLAKIDIKNPDSIPVKKIQSITKSIETDKIKFSILSELKNGNEKLDIQLVYKGIPYDSCSQGEKTILDLHMLNCIAHSLSKVGFIILDESLGTLDPSNYENAKDIIKDISANNILITSHKEGFVFSDEIINLD